MANKGGVVAIAGAAGLLALFAFTKKAKASTGPSGPPPVSEAECKTAKANRANITAAIKDIDQDIATANANMQAAANAGAEDELAYWTGVRAQLQGIRAQAVASRNNVDAFLTKCD